MSNYTGVIANIGGRGRSCVRTTSQGIVLGMEKPQQPPEGKLIAQRLRDHGQSIREAAKESGYSEGRLRQVINGYASAGKGQFIKVEAPAEALAKIAWAIGMTVNDLRSVGRADAAQRLMDLGQLWLKDQRRPAGNIERVDIPAIREWAAEPLQGDPPESLLELFSDEDLVREVTQRMARYRIDLKDYTELVTRMSQEAINNEKGGGDDGTQTSTQKTDGPDDDDLGGVTQFRPRRPSGPPNADELSEPDASIGAAADDVIPDDDEELGGSDQRE